jgi:RHS repeat-associated protein
LASAQNAGTNCATTVIGGKSEYWGNSYGYDAWGNLLQKSVTKCSAENLSVAALPNNQLTGYGYDAAGNMTSDPTDGVTLSYDQENRITGAAGYTYTYDADGNRVKKSNGSTGTLYWYMTPGIVGESDLTGVLKSEYAFFDGERVARNVYDAAGNRVQKSNGTSGTLYWYMAPGIVAESDLSGNPTSEYVFFNGERVARKDFSSGAVSYYFSDHLKTASVITDAAGHINAESDYYPWGGELQFVNNDSNHYKFTGKERDSETQLDYFGARYYSNGLGRWATADSVTLTPDLTDPQTLNKYSYAFNRPTVLIDSDGNWPGWYHHIIIEDTFGTWGSHAIAVLEAASDWVDSVSAGNQSPEMSYMHSMRDGEHHQTVEDAAMQSANYVTAELEAAVQAQLKFEANGGEGRSDDALTHFGHALHTVTDATSPEHAGFQPWYCLMCYSAYRHHAAEEESATSSLSTDIHARFLAHLAADNLKQRYEQELADAKKKNAQKEAKKKKKKK